MNNKILETQRLILQELTDSHFDDLAALLANPVVHQHFPKILSREESEEFLHKVKIKQKEDGYTFWVVIRKEDVKFIGICGLLKQLIEGVNEVEVAYRIDNQFWGNGYGTEAAKGCMDYAKDVLKVDSVISLIVPENLQSIRVAEKNGLSVEKKTIFHDRLHLVFRKKLTK